LRLIYKAVCQFPLEGRYISLVTSVSSDKTEYHGKKKRKQYFRQLYRGDQFYWWRKPEYPEKTLNLPQVTDILFLLRKSSISTANWFQTRNEIYKEGKQHKQETTDNYAQVNDLQLMTNGNTPHTLQYF
jgi:hypothetical protein